ncbi:hypothetical protein FB45DRAFT_1002022 [Roridomyces roridus]|uniref:Uncharacterized protein n=1 Tax=Roridomyces roridus TaxID=1738132 RepID=A0AAD7BYB1_9AGAR|nr:hypothetical protein FB45DRAFT_1002022 [Roridomyces roridus]
MPRKEILRFAALQWIRHIKDNSQMNFTRLQFSNMHKWISLLCRCNPDADLLDALKDLDLGQICSIFKPDSDTEYHLYEHECGLLQPSGFAEILDWIRKAPSPPPELLRQWEQQKNAVKECYSRLQSEMYPDRPVEVDSDSGFGI